MPLLLSTWSTSGLDTLLHPAWLAYGSASAYVMHAYRDWPGYAGSVAFTVFLTSVFPAVLCSAARAATGRVARTLGLAWLLVCILVVSNVFTVAYAFVPGGEYFRERTGTVLAVQMAGLALAFRWPAFSHSGPLRVQTLSRQAKTAAGSALAVLTVASLLVSLYRWPSVVIKPHRPGSRLARMGIWTVHFGIDNEGRDSQRRMRDLIKCVMRSELTVYTLTAPSYCQGDGA